MLSPPPQKKNNNNNNNNDNNNNNNKRWSGDGMVTTWGYWTTWSELSACSEQCQGDTGEKSRQRMRTCPVLVDTCDADQVQVQYHQCEGTDPPSKH